MTASAGKKSDVWKWPVRITLAATLLSGALAVGSMVYGIYYFPDAPLRESATGYENKSGKPRTRQEYQAFVVWQRVLVSAFVATFAYGFTFAALDARRAKSEK